MESTGRTRRSARKRARRPWIAAAIGVIVLAALLLAVPHVVTSVSPAFFGRYHDLVSYTDGLQVSLHSEVGCHECHVDPRGGVVYTLALAGDFYQSLVATRDAPAFLRFDRPPREACLACHETAWSKEMQRIARVPHPAHLRVADETRQCVECHTWTAHREAFAEEHAEMPFSGICVAYGCHSGFRSEDECASCHHVLRDQPEEWIAEHRQVTSEIGVSACLEFCHDASQCRLCHTTGPRWRPAGQ